MKKITTFIICTIFALSTFAQEKKEPTKKETFDFIISILNNHTGFDDGQAVIDVINYSAKDLTITYTADNGEIIRTDNLNDLSKVDIGGNDSEDTLIPIGIEFNKSQYVKYKDKTYWDGVFKNYPNLKLHAEKSTDIFFSVKNKIWRDRLFKALTHMLNLNGGVDAGLFDD